MGKSRTTAMPDTSCTTTPSKEQSAVLAMQNELSPSSVPSVIEETSHPCNSSTEVYRKQHNMERDSETMTQQRHHEKTQSYKKKRSVDFSTTALVMSSVTLYDYHLEEGLDPAEAFRRRSLLWYQGKDYQEFLKDRVATIRVCRTLQGDLESGGLGDYYCLRGLEPYQSPSLHAELMAHRAMHVQTVLNEQLRLKLHPDSKGKSLAESIQPYVKHMSQWATQRARNLAEMDALEVQSILQNSKGRASGRRRSCLGIPSSSKRRRVTHRSSLPLQQPSMTSFTSPATPGLDLVQLREMNRQLLQSIQVDNKLQPEQPNSANNDNDLDKISSSSTNSTPMSLHALLREGNATSSAAIQTATAALKNNNTKLLPTGRSYTALSRQILQEQAYQMVRRDSLGGAKKR
jgi:hypothetical protein